MSGQHILFLGYGFVARALAHRLLGAGWHARATFRQPGKESTRAADGVERIHWRDDALERSAVHGASAILISTPPDDRGCPALRATHEALAGAPPCWIGYLSTNGVYGDHRGALVDETSPLLAASPRALNRIAAERAWATFALRHGHHLVIFRLPGIYGPGRSAFDQIREGRAQRVYKAGQVFSRMHVEDIAAAIEAGLRNPAAGALFNLADDEPAPPQDVVEYACRLLGVEPPPLVPIELAALSEMARSFYADNKRVSNTLMKRALGVRLLYPTYREGLTAILAAERESAAT